MSQAIEPFEIRVPDAVLDDLRERLSRTRFPDEVNDDRWSYGTQLSYLRELVEYWRDKFGWRAQEAALNAFAQYTTPIEGLRIHFIHERSTEPNAFPLLITHGWPGSVMEFMKIIRPLVDPVTHGGKAEDAFHVVCPSLPGYGFSQAAREPGMNVEHIARIEAALMERLGYARYGAQGGDWGSAVSTDLGRFDPDHCVGIHLNMVFAPPPPDAKPSPDEKKGLARIRRFRDEELGYSRIQGTKPQTLGYGLNDSPAGLAAWIVEKFRTWSDCKGEVERRFTKDELLTNIMIYWVTQSITSSTRLYLEAVRSQALPGQQRERCETPTAIAMFPGEMSKPPRPWVERLYNVQHWTDMPRGGHFAALEEPELLVEDIRRFFRRFRGANPD